MIIDGKSFGGKVRELRKQKGLTLAALAEKTRRSVSLISQIETGNISPSFSSMQIIADALGVPLGRIMSEDTVSEGGDCCVMSAPARKILLTEGGVQHQLLSRGLSLPFEFNILELPPGVVHRGLPLLPCRRGVRTHSGRRVGTGSQRTPASLETGRFRDDEVLHTAQVVKPRERYRPRRVGELRSLYFFDQIGDSRLCSRRH